jgi:hypothetical protein
MEKPLPAPAVHAGPPKITKGGVNIAHGKRTPVEQEALYAKVVEQDRRNAEIVRDARRGTNRGTGEWRHVGTIPRELHDAMIRTTGDKKYWRHGGLKTLQKHGLAFPR